MCALLRVRLLEDCIAKTVFFCFCRNLHFLGFTVLPWQATALPLEMGCPVRAQLHPRHGTTASIAAVIFYCRWKSGTTALCAILPPGRYYRVVASAWGLVAGRGSSNSPIPIRLFLPTPSLSLSLKNGAGDPRRISVSGRSPRIPTGGIVPHHFLLPWTKVFPQIPLFLGCSLASRLLGRNLSFLRF